MNESTQPQFPGGRIFHTYRRWPLVPTHDLRKLRAALLQCMAAAASETAEELLALVEEELHRRRTHPPLSFTAAERDRPQYKTPGYRRVEGADALRDLSG